MRSGLASPAVDAALSFASRAARGGRSVCANANLTHTYGHYGRTLRRDTTAGHHGRTPRQRSSTRRIRGLGGLTVTDFEADETQGDSALSRRDFLLRSGQIGWMFSVLGS